MVVFMMAVQNRIKMINLIEKIERNRKYADEMHVKNVSILMKSRNKNKATKRSNQSFGELKEEKICQKKQKVIAQ